MQKRGKGRNMTGKEKCEMFRQIRAAVARDNHIPLHQEPCDYPGDDCPGTCILCEQELLYLDRALEKRRQQGENVMVERRREEELEFHSEPAVPEEEEMDPNDLILDLSDAEEAYPSVPELSRRLAEVGLTSVADIQRYHPEELGEKFGLTSVEVEALRQLMGLLHIRWEKASRRYRSAIRGWIRGFRYEG